MRWLSHAHKVEACGDQRVERIPHQSLHQREISVVLDVDQIHLPGSHRGLSQEWLEKHRVTLALLDRRDESFDEFQ